MSLPSLHALLNTGLPIVVCARPWARDLLAGYPLAGFLEMKGRWREDRACVASHRKSPHASPLRGSLPPDGELFALGRPGGKNGPHASPLRGSLPPEGELFALGRPVGKKTSRYARAHGLLLPDSLSSAMVFRFAGIPSCGYRDDGRSLILRWPISKPPASTHAVQSWYHLTTQALQRWDLLAIPDRAPDSLGLRLAARHFEEGERAMDDADILPGKFILIAPTATGLHRGQIKVWPHFEALTQALKRQGHTVVMCPPPAEAAEARRNAPSALCLPPMKLGAFATLAQSASLVICNDSGVSHIAAAAQAKQLTLFGVTRRERTGPWSQQATCLGSEGNWPTLDEVLQQALLLASSINRPA